MSDYIQLCAIRGHSEKKNKNILQDDFYTLCQKELHKNIGLRKRSNHEHGEIVFKFSEVDINYLYSDFVRFCLSFYKINGNLYYGELSLIPKQPIPISKELKDYIESFLPDYYGLRK